MDIAEKALKAAEAQEKAVAIMKRCQTPDEVRTGLLQVADLMSENFINGLLLNCLPTWFGGSFFTLFL